MPPPNVITPVVERKSNFTLLVYSYRKLTADEMAQCLIEWLSKSGKKRFPKNGKGELFTIYGLDSI
jgi:hypothetical protein